MPLHVPVPSPNSPKAWSTGVRAIVRIAPSHLYPPGSARKNQRGGYQLPHTLLESEKGCSNLLECFLFVVDKGSLSMPHALPIERVPFPRPASFPSSAARSIFRACLPSPLFVLGFDVRVSVRQLKRDDGCANP